MPRTFRFVIALVFAAAGCHGILWSPNLFTPEPTSPAEAEAKKKLGQTFPPNEREGVALALSKITDQKLESVAGYYPDARASNARPITLENELAYLGAKVAPDGKLRDRQGKEIFVDLRYGSGVAKTTEMIRAEWEQQKKFYDELRKTHAIVVVDLDPYHMAPLAT